MSVPLRPFVASIFALFIVAGCAPTQELQVTSRPAPTATPPERPVPYPIAPPPDYRAALANNTRTQAGRPGPDYWIQEATYRLRASIDPLTKLLTGSGEIVYTNNSPDTLDVLHLELVQNFHREGAVRVEMAEVTGGVDLARIAIGGEDLPPIDLVDSEEGPIQEPYYEVLGTNLALYPDEPVAPGASVTIEADWSFTIPHQGAGARMGHNRENLIYVAYWYPVMAVYDDVEGWVTDQFMGTAEFYADFADYEIEIEMPAGWVVMSTGTLENAGDVLAPDVVNRMMEAHQSDAPVKVISPDDFGLSATRGGAGDVLTWRFSAKQVRDVAFSATSESIWEAARTPVGDRDGDGVTDYIQINTFFRETAPFWEEVTEYQQHAITFLSDYTGFSYPWPQMTAVEGGGIIGGGMEFPMMTLIGDYNQRGDSALYYVTAHELGHMWIPMIANINERQFSWIDEGFTTFAENEARMDYSPGRSHHLEDQETYVLVARQEAEGALLHPSGFHPTPLAFGIASYMKPATLLVALREVIGERAFQRAYETFIDEWAFKHPYPWDLFNTFERVSGRDLDWFWRSWYYETWTLDQAVEAVLAEDDSSTIVIRDEGLAPMPVRLEITLEDGTVLERTATVDVWLTGKATATVTVPTASPVVRVEIDPERRFPDVDRGDNVWTREGEDEGGG